MLITKEFQFLLTNFTIFVHVMEGDGNQKNLLSTSFKIAAEYITSFTHIRVSK